MVTFTHDLIDESHALDEGRFHRFVQRVMGIYMSPDTFLVLHANILGDLTRWEGDAIVNAANPSVSENIRGCRREVVFKFFFFSASATVWEYCTYCTWSSDDLAACLISQPGKHYGVGLCEASETHSSMVACCGHCSGPVPQS